MKLYFIQALLLLIIFGACSTQKTYQSSSDRVIIEEPAQVIVEDPSDIVIDEPAENNEEKDTVEDSEEEVTEERTLDELIVTAPRNAPTYSLERYNPSEARPWDLKHMDLDLRFDWINQHVLGRADLLLTPYFYDQNTLVLDAKGFDIIDIAREDGRSYDYDYNGQEIEIILDQNYKYEDELRITIDYVAKPQESSEGGSAAITSDQGLFFINPLEKEKNKPRQIWTQGETEHNSRWFPTIDQPNENLTHDIYLTVEDKFKTLSNGALISSKQHSNDTRTDHWKMDKPHAPYLVMIAVGDFAKVSEEVDGVLLEYYVEPEYESYAKQIFAHTPEMIQFFSDLLDYPYPWNKYSQIITRDYVSGAMENTTAVIYGEFVQKTDRELIDNSNDYIVAHELFHHWFGDLVTCESWANLTLQEGFANYSEHLWQEYKYGPDAAGYQRKSEKQGYLSSIMQTGIHPLIHYGYEDKEQMFDGHSYNKGGLVLHMLRHMIGDDAFFSGLNLYLNNYKYSAVEVDELRMAFEDVTGTDLSWFFNQWYHEAGHPSLELAYNYDPTEGVIVMNVDQNQDPQSSIPIFQLPVLVSVYNEDGIESQFEILIDERNDKLELVYDEQPALIVFDRNDHLLFIKEESKSTSEYINQYNWVDTYIHRFEAINKILRKSEASATLEKALGDSHFSIRKLAVENVRLVDNPEMIDEIKMMSESDAHSAVRAAALKKLSTLSSIEMQPIIEKVFEMERAYPVINQALLSLNRIDQESAIAKAIELKKEKTSLLTSSVSAILSGTGDPEHLAYFENQLETISLFSVFNFYNYYYELLRVQSPEIIADKADRLFAIAINPGSNIFYKYTSTNTLYLLSNDLKISSPEQSSQLKDMIEEIKNQETNPMLQQRYSGF